MELCSEMSSTGCPVPQELTFLWDIFFINAL